MRYPMFVGGSYETPSPHGDVQRTINLYPEIIESKAGKNNVILVGTPGLKPFCEIGSGPIRAIGWTIITYQDKYWFLAISGDEIYRVLYDGTDAVKIGDIADDEHHSPAQIAYSLIASGGKAYYYDTEDHTVKEVSDLSGCTIISAAYLDNYYIAAESAKFYISTPLNPNEWDLLDYGTISVYPDGIRNMIADRGELWLFGGANTEVMYNSGDADFPFQRQTGGLIPQGILAPYSAVAIDNSLIWVGHGGIVWQARSFIPQRISTIAVERDILEFGKTYATNQHIYYDCRAWSYFIGGHVFYVLCLGDAQTWVYDSISGLWHEWLYYDSTEEEFFGHLGRCGSFTAGKTLVGSRVDGRIWELDTETYTDDGDAIWRVRRAPHIAAEGQLFTYHNFQLDMEVGNAPAGITPTMYLRYSNDGGVTWSDYLPCSAGESGEYKHRVVWRRLGSARDRVFEVSSSAAMRHVWVDAFINHLGVAR